jgi:hypothetical protein
VKGRRYRRAQRPPEVVELAGERAEVVLDASAIGALVLRGSPAFAEVCIVELGAARAPVAVANQLDGGIPALVRVEGAAALLELDGERVEALRI